MSFSYEILTRPFKSGSQASTVNLEYMGYNCHSKWVELRDEIFTLSDVISEFKNDVSRDLELLQLLMFIELMKNLKIFLLK